jgi:hypothetical protein
VTEPQPGSNASPNAAQATYEREFWASRNRRTRSHVWAGTESRLFKSGILKGLIASGSWSRNTFAFPFSPHLVAPGIGNDADGLCPTCVGQSDDMDSEGDRPTRLWRYITALALDRLERWQARLGEDPMALLLGEMPGLE